MAQRGLGLHIVWTSCLSSLAKIDSLGYGTAWAINISVVLIFVFLHLWDFTKNTFWMWTCWGYYNINLLVDSDTSIINWLDPALNNIIRTQNRSLKGIKQPTYGILKEWYNHTDVWYDWSCCSLAMSFLSVLEWVTIW